MAELTRDEAIKLGRAVREKIEALRRANMLYDCPRCDKELMFVSQAGDLTAETVAHTLRLLHPAFRLAPAEDAGSLLLSALLRFACPACSMLLCPGFSSAEGVRETHAFRRGEEELGVESLLRGLGFCLADGSLQLFTIEDVEEQLRCGEFETHSTSLAELKAESDKREREKQ